MRIGVKVGSAVLTDGNGKIHREIIEDICDQLAYLKQRGHEVFLVSSGAIACDPNRERSDCLRAAIGQLELLDIYKSSLEKWGIKPAQLLYVDLNLFPPHNEHTKAVLEEGLKDPEVLFIVNANDPVDGYEARALQECSDNDTLFKKVCLLTGVDMAVIGFTEKGLYDKNGEVISIAYLSQKQELLKGVRSGNSLGHGQKGMETKNNCMFELAENGIYSLLMPAQRGFILQGVWQVKTGLFKTGTFFSVS